jgi:hypothetical protein
VFQQLRHGQHGAVGQRPHRALEVLQGIGAAPVRQPPPSPRQLKLPAARRSCRHDRGGLGFKQLPTAVARHELPERLYRRIAGARWQRPEVCDQLRRQFSSPVDAPADLGTKKY